MTAAEKFERHGHLPAAFLVLSGAIPSVERALFAAGFETIVLRGDSHGHEDIFKAFDLLYSAGFVILADAETLDADVKRALQQTSAERSVFDVSEGAQEISGSELVSRVLTFAQSLRLGTRTEKGE